MRVFVGGFGGDLDTCARGDEKKYWGVGRLNEMRHAFVSDNGTLRDEAIGFLAQCSCIKSNCYCRIYNVDGAGLK